MPRYFSLSTSYYFREYCLKEKLFIQRDALLINKYNTQILKWHVLNNDIKEKNIVPLTGATIITRPNLLYEIQ